MQQLRRHSIVGACRADNRENVSQPDVGRSVKVTAFSQEKNVFHNS